MDGDGSANRDGLAAAPSVAVPVPALGGCGRTRCLLLSFSKVKDEADRFIKSHLVRNVAHKRVCGINTS